MGSEVIEAFLSRFSEDFKAQMTNPIFTGGTQMPKEKWLEPDAGLYQSRWRSRKLILSRSSWRREGDARGQEVCHQASLCKMKADYVKHIGRGRRAYLSVRLGRRCELGQSDM
jgi:hypothetical protein